MDKTQDLHVLVLNLNADPSLITKTRQILNNGYKEIKCTYCLTGVEDCRKELACLAQKNPVQMIICLCERDHLEQLTQLIATGEKEVLSVPLVAIAPTLETEEIIHLFEAGVSDFILPPLKEVDFWPRLLRLVSFQQQNKTVEWQLKEKLGLRQIIGDNPIFQKEFRKIPVAAESDAQVLITGETGTGKELFARAVHYLSPRSEKPFVPLNCGALPAELMENELFGHRKGAYTGAHAAEEGLVQQAEGGTLFLDDVDCLTPKAQTKLLRFLQEKEYRRLGSKKIRKSDVRIIAATNLVLEEAVRSGEIRSDLYYRLNVIPLHLPPLRERQSDILLLAHFFLRKFCHEFGKQITDFGPRARQNMLLYDWPGNIRELQNVVKRAVLFAEDRIINDLHTSETNLEEDKTIEPFNLAKAAVIENFEKEYISSLLQIHNGNITHAARAAKKHRRAFWELIRKHRIDVDEFRTQPDVV